MGLQGAKVGIGCTRTSSSCPDKFGCIEGVCPDFSIKRHDTKPPLRIAVEDCDGPLDLSDENLIVEVNMWAKAKLKKEITNSDTYFALADNIGFEQILAGDIIVMDRVRGPEHMLVTGFDENLKLVQVQRAYHGTQASSWKKGTPLRIFRLMNAPASIETELDDLTQEDGTVLEDQVVATYLVYNWSPEATCTPGCYWLEFKLLKMQEESVTMLSATTPSQTPSFTPSNSPTHCGLGDGVEWARRFPSNGEAFLIKIEDSFTPG